MFISVGIIQLPGLHHGSSNSNHKRSEEGAVCLSPADTFFTSKTSLTLSISLQPLTSGIRPSQHLVGGTPPPLLSVWREDGQRSALKLTFQRAGGVCPWWVWASVRRVRNYYIYVLNIMQTKK